MGRIRIESFHVQSRQRWILRRSSLGILAFAGTHANKEVVVVLQLLVVLKLVVVWKLMIRERVVFWGKVDVWGLVVV